MNVLIERIPNVMRLSGGDLEGISIGELSDIITGLDLQASMQYIEHLTRTSMIVFHLPESRGDSFLSDGEIRFVEKPPPIATGSPCVVVRVLCIHHFHCRLVHCSITSDLSENFRPENFGKK